MPFEQFSVKVIKSTTVESVNRDQPSPVTIALAAATHALNRWNDAPKHVHECEGRHVIVEGGTRALCYYADGRLEIQDLPLTETTVADSLASEILDQVRADIADAPPTVFYPALLYRIAASAPGKGDQRKRAARAIFRELAQDDPKLKRFHFLFEKKLEMPMDESAVWTGVVNNIRFRIVRAILAGFASYSVMAGAKAIGIAKDLDSNLRPATGQTKNSDYDAAVKAWSAARKEITESEALTEDTTDKMTPTQKYKVFRNRYHYALDTGREAEAQQWKKKANALVPKIKEKFALASTINIDVEDFKILEMDESLTPGAARALSSEGGCTCPSCGFTLPKYPGRYPAHCPACSAAFAGGDITPDVPPSTMEAVNESSNVILQQLGGSRFMVMTGAKPLTGDAKTLHLKLGRNAKNVTHVVITLEGNDTYTMKFLKIRGAHEPKVAAEIKDVYADQLASVFTQHTGLHTSLGTLGSKKESMQPRHLRKVLETLAAAHLVEACVKDPGAYAGFMAAPTARHALAWFTKLAEASAWTVPRPLLAETLVTVVGPGAVDDPDYAGVSDGTDEIIDDSDLERIVAELLGMLGGTDDDGEEEEELDESVSSFESGKIYVRNKRRYVHIAGQPHGAALLALSGTEKGSQAAYDLEGSKDEWSLDADQTLAFSGAQAGKLRRNAEYRAGLYKNGPGNAELLARLKALPESELDEGAIDEMRFATVKGNVSADALEALVQEYGSTANKKDGHWQVVMSNRYDKRVEGVVPNDELIAKIKKLKGVTAVDESVDEATKTIPSDYHVARALSDLRDVLVHKFSEQRDVWDGDMRKLADDILSTVRQAADLFRDRESWKKPGFTDSSKQRAAALEDLGDAVRRSLEAMRRKETVQHRVRMIEDSIEIARLATANVRSWAADEGVDEVQASHPSVVPFKKGQKVTWADQGGIASGTVLTDVGERYDIKIMRDGGTEPILVKRKALKLEGVDEALKQMVVWDGKIDGVPARILKTTVDGGSSYYYAEKEAGGPDYSVVAHTVRGRMHATGARDKSFDRAEKAWAQEGERLRKDESVDEAALGKATEVILRKALASLNSDDIAEAKKQVEQALRSLTVKKVVMREDEVDEAVSKKVDLLRDGKPVLKGATEFEVMEYIHRHHSYSLSHGLAYEGYRIVPTGKKEAADEAVVDEGVPRPNTAGLTDDQVALANTHVRALALHDSARRFLGDRERYKAAMDEVHGLLDSAKAIRSKLTPEQSAAVVKALEPVEAYYGVKGGALAASAMLGKPATKPAPPAPKSKTPGTDALRRLAKARTSGKTGAIARMRVGEGFVAMDPQDEEALALLEALEIGNDAVVHMVPDGIHISITADIQEALIALAA